MSAYASESGHWYRRDGSPAYTVIGANGTERATTLRDARKLGLVPSVTSIIRLAAAPGLERWKADQLLMAALTLPRRADEPEKEWVRRVYEDSREQAKMAAERGTEIHAAIERTLRGEDTGADFMPYAAAALDAITCFNGAVWSTERSFAHPLGFGGKVDLHAPGIVLDFKTKDGDVDDCEVYDEHRMQLAAYARGLGMPFARCAVVFVSRQLPAKARVALIPPDDIAKGWRQFLALLNYYCATTGLMDGPMEAA